MGSPDPLKDGCRSPALVLGNQQLAMEAAIPHVLQLEHGES